MHKKILITGITGFIGKHLLRKLLDNGYSIIGLVRKSSKLMHVEEDMPDKLMYYYLEDGLENLFKNNRIDGIIHLATTYGSNANFSEVLQTNLMFPLALIEQGIRHNLSFFINTDSFFVKSKGEYEYLNHYIKSKIFFTETLKTFSKKLNCVNLSLEHVYGEGDGQSKFVTDIINRLLKNEPSIALTEGKQKRDFVYIEDVTNAYSTVLQHIGTLPSYTNIEVGFGKTATIREFVEVAHRLTKSSSQLVFGALQTRQGEFKESIGDISILKSLGWQPRYPLEEGLFNVVQHQKSMI